MRGIRKALVAVAAVCAAIWISSGPAYAWSGWTGMLNMPTAVNSASVGEVNGIIYVAGGTTSGGPTAALQAYDPTKNTWATLASMPETLYQGDGAGTINSQLYVAGGWNGSLPTNTLYVYDPVSNGWTAKEAMSHLSACGVTGVINTKLYVTSPCNGFSGYFSLLDVYDPAANAWTSLPNSNTAHAAGASAVINGKLYVAGGFNGAVTRVTEVYDPVANTWTKLAKMRTPVQAASSVALDGRLWVFGGIDAGSTLQSIVQVYNPVTNRWANSSFAMPAANDGAGAAASNGIAFVEGGGGPVATNEDLIVLPSIP